MPQGTVLLPTCLLCSILCMFTVGHIGNSTWKGKPQGILLYVTDLPVILKLQNAWDRNKQGRALLEPSDEHKLCLYVILKLIRWYLQVLKQQPVYFLWPVQLHITLILFQDRMRPLPKWNHL